MAVTRATVSGFGAQQSDGGNTNVFVPGADIASGAQVVKSTSGRLCRVILTTINGANQINITDGVGGSIIGVIAATAAAGSILNFQTVAVNSINIPQTAAAADLTITIV